MINHGKYKKLPLGTGGGALPPTAPRRQHQNLPRGVRTGLGAARCSRTDRILLPEARWQRVENVGDENLEGFVQRVDERGLDRAITMEVRLAKTLGITGRFGLTIRENGGEVCGDGGKG